ncbi:MAG: glycosyltransferase family 39 protein, partial [Victivallales bacterium]|nr:glycosyltransferase family 39 protein [Victivallales bacterium]
MIYEENTPHRTVTVLFLVLTILLFYPLWQLGDRELYWSESSYAAMAMETDYLAPSGQAHGEIIPQAFPLLPMAAAALHNQLKVPMELALRLPSWGALVLLALLVWMSARHAAGATTAAVAVAILISSNIILEKAVDGYPDMVGVLFLFAGWMLWFRIGAVRGNWNLAWLVSLTCCGLAFYTIGWAGVVFFFTPLIFMRRPLTLWRKLQRPGFYIGLGVVALFV